MKNLNQILRKYFTSNDYKQVFIDFNKSLKLISDKNALISNTITRINELVSPKHIHFFIVNPDTNQYEFTATTGLTTKLSNLFFYNHEGIINWLRINEKHLLISDKPEFASIYSANDLAVLQTLECQIVFPLKVMNTLKGLVLLGPKTKRNTKYSSDEIEMLSILLDNAAIAIENISFYEEQKERLKKMYRADKLAVIGQLAAGAAHEIRNPLTSIRSTIQYVQKDIQNPEKRQMVNEILNEVDRINEIIKGMLSFSRQSEPAMEPVDLKFLLEQTLALISNTALNKGISIVFDYKAMDKIITADNAQLKQVFLNIILNAVEAIEKDGRIRVLVARKNDENHTDKNSFYLISIKDNGKGISGENIEKVFDPFFTTKIEGTGLGLSICYGIIHKHNGEIEINSEYNKGTEVIIKLPINPLLQ
jgi:signal transduction histidine kinase